MSAEQNFRVDLQGLVDLLSHHLYSGPGVYVRELVQNSVDAITARRETDPGHRGTIRITPADVSDDGSLCIADDGIGLDEDDIRAVLSTIGATSKRDELGFQRDGFLGQFGIGLLACFMVSDRIEVRTRAGDGRTWRWSGRSDGTYEPPTRPRTELPEQGTEVTARARPPPRAAGHAEAVRGAARHEVRRVPARSTSCWSPATGDGAAAARVPLGVRPTRRRRAAAAARRPPHCAASSSASTRSTRSSSPTRSRRRARHRLRVAPPGRPPRSATASTPATCSSVSSADSVLPEWAFFRPGRDQHRAADAHARRASSCTRTSCSTRPASGSAARSRSGSSGWSRAIPLEPSGSCRCTPSG